MQGELATQSHTRSPGFYLAFKLQAFDGDELRRREPGVFRDLGFARITDQRFVLLWGEHDGIRMCFENGV